MGVILTLPRLGETMEEARVTDWLVAPGQPFRRGQVLLEVETDKTVVEVPAMQDGVLVAQLVAPGEMVALDAPIAEVAGDAAPPTPIPTPQGGGEAQDPTDAACPVAGKPAPMLPVGTAPAGPGTSPPPRGEGMGGTTPGGRTPASPAARRLARASGVDLAGVPGTGRRGRVTGADVRGAGIRATVVLLHGLHDHARGWRDLPDRLMQAGHPVLVPDLPGHGDSTATADDLAGAVEALVPLLPDGLLRLVGHSLGAVLATMLARRLGPRAEALLLIAPAGLGPRINADFLDLMAQADTTAALGRALAMLGAGPVSDLALTQELARLQRQRPATAALVTALARNGVQQADIAPDLARLTCPVTAVFGLADRIIDWHDCASLPATAAIHLVPGAGHLPHVHAPALVLSLITGGAPTAKA
jgi:pimeloyl-ACP methyl ester carboxylesterase